MKICIYGAGAIGGFIGAKLAETDVEVALVARGPHLDAIKANGLTLRTHDSESVVSVTATDDPSWLGPQDFVIITLKAHSVPGIVTALEPLLGPRTAVVTASNGIPWWYFHAHGGTYEGRRLATVDPGNLQWRHIGPARAIGCVAYPACEIVEPGVIEHLSGNRFTLGEPSGEKTDRVSSLSRALIAADLRAPIRRIRNEIWMKLWGNLSFNPISALTGATLDVIATESPGTRDVARAMMLEAQAIGETLGIRFSIGIDRRIDGAAEVGAHRTSMLQDLERGRPMEIDALIGSVQELGQIVGIPTPTIDVVLALVKQKAAVAGALN
ncbi:MAG: 2-dehydropantoate 2-reductase [Gammaproteobacteria bacterium]|nr:2-dehydropantoate 2-reductase [Gammaproteobacteria bacterium]